MPYLYPFPLRYRSEQIAQVDVDCRDRNRHDHDWEAYLEVVQERDFDAAVRRHASDDEVCRSTDKRAVAAKRSAERTIEREFKERY